MTPHLTLPVTLFIGRSAVLPESGRPSAIAKRPVIGPLQLRHDGFVGDEQADRRVHGGSDKAVHLYPPAHYARLAGRFPDLAQRLVPGGLGENISADGFREAQIALGDIFRLGSARLQICQPRQPCWKIDEHLGQEGVAAYIAEHGLAGWYLRVLDAGRVEPGDPLELLERLPQAPSLADTLALTLAHRPDLERFAALCEMPAIAAGWRDKLQSRLDWLRRTGAAGTPGST